IEDTPCYKTFAPDSDDVNYSEGSLVGYRWYNAKKIPVQFPFGWGLSYTTFRLSVSDPGLSIDKSLGFERVLAPAGCKQAVVTVENTGKYAGSQVIQVYMEGQLCGFSKVFVNPGTSKSVIIELENYQSAIKEEMPPITENFHNPLLDKEGFSLSSPLGDMAKKSFGIKMLMKILTTAIAFMSHKSKEDPSVKIAIAAICENPLESLISTSGGMISEKIARKIVKIANKNRKRS
nr:hypothetical protein [Treponema sp.]